MISIFIIGLLLFISVIVIFKILYFLLIVLLAGAGFIVKLFVVLFLFVPLLPITLILIGGIFSVPSILLIITCGLLISLVSKKDGRSHY